MKKAFILITLLTFFFFYGKGQYTIQQNLGSPATLVKTPNYGGIQGGLIPYTFSDTTSTNTALTFLKTYNGALIYTTSDSALYFRSSGASKWTQILPSGGTSGLNAWLVGGNTPLLTDANGNATFGANQNSGILFRTNSTTRLLLDKTGILDYNNASVKVLGVDTLTRKLVFKTTASQAAWALVGNAGTTAGTNFIGTTDAVSLMFKVNNVRAGFLHPTNGNTSFGVNALMNTLGGTGNNTAIGVLSLYNATTSTENTSVGDGALFNNTTGGFNTAIGSAAGSGITTGTGNTFLGYQNSNYSSGLTGYAAIFTNGTEKLGINSAGAVQFSIGGYGTSGYLVQSNGSGAPPSYINPSSIVTAVPTLQQVITAGATLTGNNTIVNGANTLTITNNTVAGNALELKTNSTTAAATQTMLYINLLGANANSGQSTYGIQSINAHSGSSSVNYGVYGAASTGITNIGGYFTGTQYGVIVPSGGGNVGIGTSTPDSNLTVQLGLYSKRGVRFSGLLPSANATDSMMVVDASNGNVGYRAIPSGGGVSAPSTEMIYGTGASVTSSPNATFNGSNLNITGLTPRLNTTYTPTEVGAAYIDNGKYNGLGFTGIYANGTLVIVYREGTNHVNHGVIKMRTSTNQGLTWSSATTIQSDGTYDLRNVGGGVSPTGRLIVQYIRYDSATNTAIDRRQIYSDDFGATFSSPVVESNGTETSASSYGGLIAIGDGKIAIPWYGETGTAWSSYIAISSDNGATWTNTLIITGGNLTYDETSLVYLGGGYILGLIRNESTVVYRQVLSSDNGATWTDQGATAITVDAPQPAWLATYLGLDGRRMVVAYYSNLEVKAIYGTAKDLIAGVSGWKQNTIATVSNTALDAGKYPSIIHPFDQPYGVGFYWYQASSTVAPLGFVIAPKTNGVPQNVTFASTVTIGGLTSGRVPFVSTGGLITNDASFTYDNSIANLTIAKNQNGTTGLNLTNTTSAGGSGTTINFNNSSGASVGQLFKGSPGTGAYKTFTASAFGMYNGVAGDIALLNDYASGAITLAAGGHSTADLTVASSGAVSISGALTVTGLSTFNGALAAASGSNKSVGQAVLVGGTVTVSNTRVTASSIIFLTDATTGSLVNIGTPTVGTITAGTSFVINSSNALDASAVNWIIINNMWLLVIFCLLPTVLFRKIKGTRDVFLKED